MVALAKPSKIVLILALAAAVFVVSQAAGWYAARRPQVERQRDLISQIEKLGGNYYYDFQLLLADGEEELADQDSPQVDRHWLSPFLGVDWFHDIFYISFAQFDSFQKDGGIPASRDEIGDQELAPLAEHESLRWLALSGTAMTDAGLEALSRLPKLERLWVSGTRISDQGLTSLGGSAGLTHLAIENTATTDQGLQAILSLPNLRVLSLGSPYLTTAGLQQLDQGSRLSELYLDGSPVDDSVAKSISQLTELKTLSIRGARISERGMRYLQELKKLQILRLDGSSINDESLGAAEDWKQLRELTLSGTRISDAGLEALGPCLALEELNIAGTECTLKGILELFKEQQGRSLAESLAVAFVTSRNDEGELLSLELEPVLITDSDVALISGLSSLQWLSMTNNELTDAGATTFAQADWPHLELLKLDGANITEQGIRELARLPSLRRLHLPGVDLPESKLRQLRDEFPKLRIYNKEFSSS